MFRTDLLSVIRSLNTVYRAIRVCHASYVDCLLARSGWNMFHPDRGREVDHLPLSRAEVKNEWIYTCTFPYNMVCIGLTLTLRSTHGAA